MRTFINRIFWWVRLKKLHRIAAQRAYGFLAIIVVMLLSACAPAAQPTPTIPPTSGAVAPTSGAATVEPTIPPAVTSTPGATAQPTVSATATGAPTSVPTVVPTAQPTIQPTTAPTTQPGRQPLVGPEWRILGQGDLYGTGVETVVAYWPSSVVARPQLPAEYVGYGVAAEQVVVVQRNPNGQPWVRLQISLAGLFFNGDNRNAVTQPGVPDSRTIAFALAMEQQSAPIRLVPIDAQGKPVANGFAARYTNAGMVVETFSDTPGAPQPLVGPEWRILGQGDLYGTGVETVVAYRPASMGPAQAQLPPEYVGYGVVLEQLAIVQRNANGQPWIRVLVSPGGVFLNGDDRNPVFPPGGPNSRTVAFALAMEQQSAPQRLVPIDAQGKPVDQGFSISYNATTREFNLNLLSLPGQPAPWPGGEWVVAHQGDFSGDGLVEKVYVLPSTLVPDSSFNTPVYAGYSWVAEAVMIAQEQDGNQRVLLTINLSEVRSESSILATLSTPAQGPGAGPAGFLIAAPGEAGAPISVIPLNANGQGYTQGFRLVWDATTGAYRIAVGPESVVQP